MKTHIGMGMIRLLLIQKNGDTWIAQIKVDTIVLWQSRVMDRNGASDIGTMMLLRLGRTKPNRN